MTCDNKDHEMKQNISVRVTQLGTLGTPFPEVHTWYPENHVFSVKRLFVNGLVQY